MINKRPYWLKLINEAWKSRPIVWLSGVRRAGKTTISKMLTDAVYLNCELPSIARRMEEPESFYENLPNDKIVIFDEVHRLEDPSLVLKIASDTYPHLKILASGSSTLSATKKFRDSLTGRKNNIYLPPVLWHECFNDFGINDLDRRLLRGGLPETLLSSEENQSFYSEWIDSFYARDIQELFGIRNRTGFLKLLQLIMRQSGKQIDYTNLANLSELSRITVKAHIEAMAVAHAVYLLSPYHGEGRREIVSRPKIYAFDTGFVSFVNGWNDIRDEDRGHLWEHLVLDQLRTAINDRNLFYWRDKSDREIDFIIRDKDNKVHTIECKINPDKFSPTSLSVFRTSYPEGENLVVSPFVKELYTRKYEKLIVKFVPLAKEFPELKINRHLC